MQRERGELVPIGEVVSGLDDMSVPAIRDDSPQAAPLHPLRSGGPACFSPRSGPGSRFYGPHDGAVQLSPHQPRQPALSEESRKD